jgi:hypothetical protein
MQDQAGPKKGKRVLRIRPQGDLSSQKAFEIEEVAL